MGWFSVTGFATGLFMIYIANAIFHFYQLFNPPLCQEQGNCLLPLVEPSSEGTFPLLQLRIYTSTSTRQLGNQLTIFKNFQIAEESKKKVNLTLPSSTRKNGTLYVHCYLLPQDYDGEDPLKARWNAQQSSQITIYQVPVADTFQLMSNGENVTTKTEKKDKGGKALTKEQLRATQTPVTHLRSVVPLLVSYEAPHFDFAKLPGEIRHLLELENVGMTRKYLPIFYLDELSFRNKDLVQIKPEDKTVEMTIDYRPTSVGKLRLLVSTLGSLQQLKQMGFTEKDLDEVKGVFTDTNIYLLGVTFFVAALHMLFDMLSFKNDISFWRNRKTMVGLSSKALLWRAFSYTIVFLYLMDQETSLLVLVPSGISCLIEYWKVTKAFKFSFSFSTGVKWGEHSKKEEETEAFDTQAMKYLAYLMVPLCIAGAIYSLAYVPHKSWRSWLIESLANGVYAFGFLFMLPQLFVNYKLKSVAHLPWRAFMYKAFNTFIDDLFAFIITMPTAHRVACFRDDIVFLIYLYQRYLYPVDKTRVNEFGESGDDQEIKESQTAAAVDNGERVIQNEEDKKNN